MARDLEQYAQDAICEALNGDKGNADDLTSTVERLESDFDFDSFAPYTSKEDDILSDYESEHWQDAKDMVSGQTYSADVEDEPEITVSRTCTHGWAAHTREDADGTMYWESGQLDGCNGVSRKVGELWLTCTWTPAKESEENNAE